MHSKFLNDPRFAASMPNILYFYIYHPTSWFGPNHIIVAKLFNALFFGFSLFPLSATARQFITARGAYIFSLLIILSPVSSYSVYVMPEPLYFFIFWLLVYAVVVRLPNSFLTGSVCAGLLVAALSAIKPHGLIFVVTIPLVLFCLFARKSNLVSAGQLAKATLCYIIAFVAGRLCIDFAVQGHLLVSPFGSYYTELLTPSMRPRRPLLSIALWHSIRGHLSYLALFFWPAILIAVWPAEPSERDASDATDYLALLSFSLVSLLFLILMAAKYTADVSAVAVPGHECRLQGHYYDFVFGPLLLSFLASTRSRNVRLRFSRLFSLVLIIGTIAASLSAYFAFTEYCPTILDFPEVVGVWKFPIGRALAIAGSTGCAMWLALF